MDEGRRRWHYARLLGVLTPLLLALGLGASSVGAQAGPTVQTRDLGGNTGIVLTDGQGKTLYTFSLDTDGTSHCADQCATAWPPLTLASGNPVAPSGLSGTLGVISRSDGQRLVTYNNQPLYYFSGDSAAGQANGNGRTAFNGTWRVAQPAGVPNASSGAPAPGSSGQPAAPSALPAGGTGGLIGKSSHSSALLLAGLGALLLSGTALLLARSNSR